MEERVRVLVADDQDLVRSGFKLILMSYDGIDVVGEARDGHEAVELASRLHPDVVLMDIRMPRMSGIEATRAIRDDAALENVHVLILTTIWTNTCTMLWPPGPAAFCSKMPSPTRSLPRCVLSPRGMRSSSPLSHAAL